VEEQNLHEYPDEALLTRYDDLGQSLAKLTEKVGKLKQEIMRRAEARGATGILSDEYICRIKTVNTYDPSILVALKERLDELGELNHCYAPEHQETITVAEKWNVTKLMPIARLIGDEAMAIVERAKVPTRRDLEFKRK
jgi:hypothetical protein